MISKKMDKGQYWPKYWLNNLQKMFIETLLRSMTRSDLSPNEKERYDRLVKIRAQGHYDFDDKKWLNQNKNHWHNIYIHGE